MRRAFSFLILLGAAFGAGQPLLRASDPEYQKALDETLRFCPPGDYNNARPVRRFIMPGERLSYDLSKANLKADPPLPLSFQDGVVMDQLVALPKGVDFFPTAVEELRRKYPEVFASTGLPDCTKSLRELNDKLLREGRVYLPNGQLFQRRPAVMNVAKTLPASETKITLHKGTPVLILESRNDYQIMIGRMTFRLQASDIVLP